MKTAKKIKIIWAIVCTLIAIGLCIAVVHEWKAQGVTMPFSLIAGCLVYCAGSAGLYICGKEFVNLLDYTFGDDNEYYKGRK